MLIFHPTLMSGTFAAVERLPFCDNGCQMNIFRMDIPEPQGRVEYWKCLSCQRFRPAPYITLPQEQFPGLKAKNESRLHL